MDLEQIGYFLYMQEQEKKEKENLRQPPFSADPEDDKALEDLDPKDREKIEKLLKEESKKK